MNALNALCVAILLAMHGTAAAAMTCDERCMGNAVESCFLIAEGEITAETSAEFATLDRGDAAKILFDSPGGNLGAGKAFDPRPRARSLERKAGCLRREFPGPQRTGSGERGQSADHGQRGLSGGHAFQRPDPRNRECGPAGHRVSIAPRCRWVLCDIFHLVGHGPQHAKGRIQAVFVENA